MKRMPRTGQIVGFDYEGEVLVGYAIARSHSTDMVRVATAPGKYFWVDRALAQVV
jgi:hypothetical protein